MAKKTFICDHCSYISYKKFNLSRHIVTHHILNSLNRKSKPTFQCYNCDYVTKKRYNFKRHALKHYSTYVSTTTVVTDVNFRCYHCNYVTYKKNCLQSHMLRNHLKDRLNQPRITCSACGLKFFQRSQFREHVAGIHGITIEEEIRTFASEDGQIIN